MRKRVLGSPTTKRYPFPISDKQKDYTRSGLMFSRASPLITWAAPNTRTYSTNTHKNTYTILNRCRRQTIKSLRENIFVPLSANMVKKQFSAPPLIDFYPSIFLFYLFFLESALNRLKQSRRFHATPWRTTLAQSIPRNAEGRVTVYFSVRLPFFEPNTKAVWIV